MVDSVLQMPEGSKIMILSPIVRSRKGEYKQLFLDLLKDGFLRARIDGEVCDLSDPPTLALREKHNIDLIVDRVKVRADIKQRLADSFETALKYSQGLAVACPMEDHKIEDEVIFSTTALLEPSVSKLTSSSFTVFNVSAITLPVTKAALIVIFESASSLGAFQPISTILVSLPHV